MAPDLSSPGIGAPATVRESTYWRDHWKKQRLALLESRKSEGNSFWNDKKAITSHFIRDLNEWRAFAEARIDTMGIKKGSRVLDIGAGTGTLSIPLAARGCTVTAVEPADAMADALLRYQREQNISGVTLIRKRWEETAPGELGEPYDAVVASYSLMVTDIGDALNKIQQCCRGTAHIFWFLTQPLWAQVNLGVWKQIHGTDFCGEPTADCLWQALYEMGIYANLAVEVGCDPAYYATIDDAVTEFHGRMNCTTPEQDAILQAYFTRTLSRCDKGYFVNAQALGAHIWWNTQISPGYKEREVRNE